MCGRRGVVGVLISVALFGSCAGPQKRTDVVATVESITIDVTQLKRSFEFEPKWRKGMTNAQAYAQQLDYLINERLYALAARSAGLDRDSTIAAYLAFVRQKELIKELYHEEVAAKVVISEREYNDGYRWMKKKVTFRFVYTPDSLRSIAYARQVRAGQFETMSISDPVHEVKGVRNDVTFGDIAPEIEHAVFDGGLNDVAGPIRIQGGFMVIQIAGGLQEKFASEYEKAELQSKIRKVIFDRKADLFAREYIASVMQDKQLTLNPDVFFTLAAYTAQRVSESQIARRDPTATAVQDVELRQIGRDINAIGGRILASYRDGQLTVRQFVAKLAAMPPGMRPRIRSTQDLKDAVAIIVRNEYLAGIAETRGVEKNENVRREIETQTDEALATAWFTRQREAIAVSDEEIRQAKEKAADATVEDLAEVVRDRKFGDTLPGLANGLRQQYSVTVDSTQLKSITPHPEEVIARNPIPFFVREIFQ